MAAYISVHRTDNQKWDFETHRHGRGQKSLRMSFNSIQEMSEKLIELEVAGHFDDPPETETESMEGETP